VRFSLRFSLVVNQYYFLEEKDESKDPSSGMIGILRNEQLLCNVRIIKGENLRGAALKIMSSDIILRQPLLK